MNKITTNQVSIEQEKKIQISHYSDGSELIPAEIKSELQSSPNLMAGYRKDDEGIINNYALEPASFTATYPSAKQQLRYVFLGAGAMMFVTTLLLIAFSVS